MNVSDNVSVSCNTIFYLDPDTKREDEAIDKERVESLDATIKIEIKLERIFA